MCLGERVENRLGSVFVLVNICRPTAPRNLCDICVSQLVSRRLSSCPAPREAGLKWKPPQTHAGLRDGILNHGCFSFPAMCVNDNTCMDCVQY